MTVHSKALLTVKEVASICGLGVSTIWRNAANGTFPAPVAVCGVKRWRRDEIENLVGKIPNSADEPEAA